MRLCCSSPEANSLGSDHGGAHAMLVSDALPAEGEVMWLTSAARLLFHPLPREDCVQWTVLFCFQCVYIFLYMHMQKHRHRYVHGFPSSCLPSHSQISTLNTFLSPWQNEQCCLAAVSDPQRILVLHLSFKGCKHGKYINMPRIHQVGIGLVST